MRLIKTILSYLVTLIGIVCILIGVYLIHFYIDQNNKINIAKKQALDAATIHEVKRDEVLITQDALEVLIGDQMLEEVVTYKSVLEIPSINCITKVNDGVGSYELLTGVGRYINTAYIGNNGTTVIAGHSSDVYDCVFNDLSKVQMYDKFYLYDTKGEKHTYYITQTYVCSPYYTDLLNNDPRIGYSRVLLFCCCDGGANRYVVEGREYSEEQLQKYKDEMTSTRTEYINSVLNSLQIEPIKAELKGLCVAQSK